jgi:hypothetical protein
LLLSLAAFRFSAGTAAPAWGQDLHCESEAGEPVAKFRDCIVREVWIPLQNMPE